MYKNAFANGGVSIDAIPAIAASIPRMMHSFALTPYSLNRITGLGRELREWGYSTAFFHGAENSSMGFQALARSAGFEQYYGRTEYSQDARFDGDDDFDGLWAIWDEPFLQFFAAKISELPQPFCTAVFTASSHHPFLIPRQYENIYKEEGKRPLHECIRYTDNALRLFFDAARKKEWFKNTLFVITADHDSRQTSHSEYETELGHFYIPILFYDPQGQLPIGIKDEVAQQTDIMPTILGYLGYSRPYIAFGRDLLGDVDSTPWAFSWDHIPIWVEGEHVVFLVVMVRILRLFTTIY